jgi:hypothetical protein
MSITKPVNKNLIQSKIILSVFIFFILFLLTAAGCSSSPSSQYDSNYLLTAEIARSKAAVLNVKIPQGWFTAEDNECNCIDLWLIKDDYSATLNFVVLNVDSLTIKTIKNDELNAITEISKVFKKIKYGKNFKGFTNEETFVLNTKIFTAYEYHDESNRNIRVVVFKANDKFFELSAIPVKTENLSGLYKIQNSVLSSIK